MTINPVPRCEFPGCGRPMLALDLCQQHYRQHRTRGFLTPLAPNRRTGQAWTRPFALDWATRLLAYHAPERLMPEWRTGVPAPSRGGERR